MIDTLVSAGVPAAVRGQDFDRNHAFPINPASTSSYAGSLGTDNGSDHYVFTQPRGQSFL
jgi:hypothetical protein